MERTSNLFYTQPNPLVRMPQMSQTNVQNLNLQQIPTNEAHLNPLNRIEAKQNVYFPRINQNPQYPNIINHNNQVTFNPNLLKQSEQINLQSLLAQQNLENSLKQQNLPNDKNRNSNLNYFMISPNNQVNLSAQLLQQQQQQLQMNLNRNTSINNINLNLSLPQNCGTQQLIELNRELINQHSILQKQQQQQQQFQQIPFNSNITQQFSAATASTPLSSQNLLTIPLAQTFEFQNNQQNQNMLQNNLISNLQQQLTQNQTNQLIQPYSNNAFINNLNTNQNLYAANHQTLSSFLHPEQIKNLNNLSFNSNNNSIQQIQNINQQISQQNYNQNAKNIQKQYENHLKDAIMNDLKLSPIPKIQLNQNNNLNQNQSAQYNLWTKVNSSEDLSNIQVKLQHNEDQIVIKKQDDEFSQMKRLTDASLPSTTAISRDNEVISEFELKEKSQTTESRQGLQQFDFCKMEEKQSLKIDQIGKIKQNSFDQSSSTLQELSCSLSFNKNTQNEEQNNSIDQSNNKQLPELSKIDQSLQKSKNKTKKRKSQKDYINYTLKKKKSESSGTTIRSAFAKRNTQTISNSSEQLKDQKQESQAQECSSQIIQEDNKLESKNTNQIGEQESDHDKDDELMQKKKEMQNESNYTKNILKGFRRYFIKNFYNNKKLMNNFEKYYSINSLNNEFILKLLTVSPYTNYFKDFLEEDPEWWMDEAKISNKERQRQIFSLYQKQDISLIKTKRKNFNQKIIYKLEKSCCKEKPEGCEQEQVEQQQQEKSEVTLIINDHPDQQLNQVISSQDCQIPTPIPEISEQQQTN